MGQPHQDAITLAALGQRNSDHRIQNFLYWGLKEMVEVPPPYKVVAKQM
jgi:hypothetical protein